MTDFSLDRMLKLEKKLKDKGFARHGGPMDRGAADSYYRRKFRPHFFSGDTYQSHEHTEEWMSKEEIKAYTVGYQLNEYYGDHKDWG
jgi:hypothetical protein